MKELALFLQFLVLLATIALALWQRHYRRERQRKWNQLNEYWDLLISGVDPSTIAKPPWLEEKG